MRGIATYEAFLFANIKASIEAALAHINDASRQLDCMGLFSRFEELNAAAPATSAALEDFWIETKGVAAAVRVRNAQRQITDEFGPPIADALGAYVATGDAETQALQMRAEALATWGAATMLIAAAVPIVLAWLSSRRAGGIIRTSVSA